MMVLRNRDIKPIQRICTGYSSVSYTVHIGFDTQKISTRTSIIFCTYSTVLLIVS